MLSYVGQQTGRLTTRQIHKDKKTETPNFQNCNHNNYIKNVQIWYKPSVCSINLTLLHPTSLHPQPSLVTFSLLLRYKLRLLICLMSTYDPPSTFLTRGGTVTHSDMACSSHIRMIWKVLHFVTAISLFYNSQGWACSDHLTEHIIGKLHVYLGWEFVTQCVLS